MNEVIADLARRWGVYEFWFDSDGSILSINRQSLMEQSSDIWMPLPPTYKPIVMIYGGFVIVSNVLAPNIRKAKVEAQYQRDEAIQS